MRQEQGLKHQKKDYSGEAKEAHEGEKVGLKDGKKQKEEYKKKLNNRNKGNRREREGEGETGRKQCCVLIERHKKKKTCMENGEEKKRNIKRKEVNKV